MTRAEGHFRGRRSQKRCGGRDGEGGQRFGERKEGSQGDAGGVNERLYCDSRVVVVAVVVVALLSLLLVIVAVAIAVVVVCSMQH